MAMKQGISPVVPVDLRYTYFGTVNQMGDNLQGRCNYTCMPTIPLDFLDEICMYFNTIPYDVRSAAELYTLDQHMIMRNQSDTRVEVDCWLLWPKHDIPTTVQNGYDYTYFVANDYSAPPLVTYPYGTALIPKAPNSVSSLATEWKIVDQLAWNDWNATPYENTEINTLFKIEYKGNHLLNPGDEYELHWGIPHGQWIHPWTQLLLNAGNIATGYLFYNNYSYMKRLGPLVLCRYRGRLSHDESKSSTAGAMKPNFGLFQVEYALITKLKAVASAGYPASMPGRGTLGSGTAPWQVNQTLQTNSQQWFGTQPSEGASNP